MNTAVLLFCVTFVIQYGVSIKVLVYSPAFAPSHQNFMARLADSLTDAGHNVTFLVPIIEESRRNQLGVRRTTDVIVVEQDEEMKRNIVPVDDNSEQFWTIEPSISGQEELFGLFTDMLVENCANLVRNQHILEELNARNFDVAIIEPLHACGLALFRKLGIMRTILATSCTHYDNIVDAVGEPHELSYVPSISSQVGEKMNLMERYENYQYAKLWTHLMGKSFDRETELYQKGWGMEIADWKELLTSASIYFTNSNPFLDFPRPVFQKTVAIGGISVDIEEIKQQKLPAQWNEILGKRSKNMLISFGSMAKSYQMPLEYRDSIVQAIKANPEVTFIWKYETNDTKWADGIENVYFEKWVPQPALLADDRVSAFLTHGGLGSTNELAHFGKPAVMIPLFGDQVRNSHMLARHKSAIVLMKNELANKEKVNSVIREILYNESYKSEAIRIAEILSNQPVSPKDLVIKYTEFVAKYGPFPAMDPYGRHLNYFTRSMLDIHILMLIPNILFALFIITVVRYIFPLISVRIISNKDKSS